MADHLVDGFSTIDVLNNVLEWGWLHCIFYLIKELIRILLGILLYTSIHRLIIPVFERVAVLLRIILLFVREHKMSVQLLDLVEHVVIHLADFWGFLQIWCLVVRCHEYHVPEHLSVVDLLVHGVHVADATEVSKACVTVWTALGIISHPAVFCFLLRYVT